MLRVDLGQLRREGSVLVEARVPGDDDLWHESGLAWDGDVEVRLTAAFAGTGEVVVRGAARGRLSQDCRRCLKAVRTDFEGDLTIVFVADEEMGEDWDVYGFDASKAQLDVSEAVREELMLAVNPYVVCDPECRGLCAKCGADLNVTTCDCTEDEADPRWEALRALKNE